MALVHLLPTLLRRISLITNGACQSSIKFGLGGNLRVSVLPVGLIPEAQEAMQVPNRAGAEVNIMRAMKQAKNRHMGVQEKESEERRGHIDVQPYKGEDSGTFG